MLHTLCCVCCLCLVCIYMLWVDGVEVVVVCQSGGRGVFGGGQRRMLLQGRGIFWFSCYWGVCIGVGCVVGIARACLCGVGCHMVC